MRKICLLLVALPLILSCNGQPKPLDKAVLQLENFDFSTKISTLLPDRTQSKKYEGWYEIKSLMLSKDTVYSSEYEENMTPRWIEYRERQFSSGEVLARFNSYDFVALNFVATLDGKIMVINGLTEEISLAETQQFIALLDKKYGKAVKSDAEFFKSYDIYTWQLEDRIIKYCLVQDDESGTLKIVMDQDNKTIEAGEKKPHYNAYLYIIDKQYAGKVIGELHTGDLLYCK